MICMSQPQIAEELLEMLLQVHTHLSVGSISHDSGGFCWKRGWFSRPHHRVMDLGRRLP